MKVVFRTDASIQIGSGHVMRCLTLANALRHKGAHCIFVSRAHQGHLLNLVKQHGHDAIALVASATDVTSPQPNAPTHAAWLGVHWFTDANETQHAIGAQTADWLVVDHYALDYQWERAMRAHCQQLMVIDDLADRMHDCDVLLDQNLGRSPDDYLTLTPANATKLVGPRYALLRPEFEQLREKSLSKREQPQLKHLLISLGGVDKNDVTSDILRALCQCELPPEMRITVVMGAHAPWLEHVQTLAQSMPRPTKVLVNIKHMAELMAESDLFIGASGGTAWECCCLGLPSLITVLAQNQHSGAHALVNAQAALLFNNASELVSLLANPLIFGEQPSALLELSQKAASVTQGNGITLVTEAMECLHA